ncbi:MAG: hypothetical protein HY815_03560 [Candidatus Riflebacteria bacterium]|nr:hypothetical protein [Candidatus Riflebacteria bacterium]
MGEPPFLDWLMNVLLCLGVLMSLAIAAQALEMRKLWSPTLSGACVLYLLLMRYTRNPWIVVPAAAVFAWGVYELLDHTRLTDAARAVVALMGAVVWFGALFWGLVTLVVYFCSGCLFP